MLPDIDDTRAIIDHLTELAETDEQKFEAASREIIRRTIASFPEEYRRRAEGFQFRIDTALAPCKDPVTRMNRMVEIFWKHFQTFHDVFNNPEKVLAERQETSQPARVIPLKRQQGG